MSWFDVDKAGLAKLLARKNKAFILFEPVQNALDEMANGVTRIEVEFEWWGNGTVSLVVRDDSPRGFQNLDQAFTLFADSYKKSNPTLRGRWNLGEKLLLAMCEEARIESTTGTVVFGQRGRRVLPKKKIAVGTTFRGLLRLTREEFCETANALDRLILHKRTDNVAVIVNGTSIVPREPLKVLHDTLPTEIANDDGTLRRRQRLAEIRIYAPRAGEVPSLYEMGIPVMETGDKWHVDVCQKVPLTFERDSVPSSFLQTVRTLVFNAMHAEIEAEDANADWVRAATSDTRCSGNAITRAMDLRFTPKRVAFDPSDPEANKIAVTEGYVVVPSRALSGTEWATAKRCGAIKPAGKVTPSPKPFQEDGTPLRLLEYANWTEGMITVATYAKLIGPRLLGHAISVHIANDSTWPFVAAYGNNTLTLNLGRLGHKWFEWPANRENINALLLHELAHDKVSDHLSREFGDEQGRLGAALIELVIEWLSSQKDGASALYRSGLLGGHPAGLSG